MKMNKFVSVLTIAFAALMANVAAAGDIYEFRRCNELGQTIDPAVQSDLKSGQTGYFKLRLVKRNEGDEPLQMRYTGTGSSTLDEIYKAPTLGILVNGVYTPAKYVTQNFIGTDGPGKAIFTDLIFSYTVQAGDFAQPIVLCNQNREPITDLNGSVSYYLNFRDESLGTAVWNVDTGAEGTAGYYEASFSYASDLQPWQDTPPDGERWTDYDLAKANLQVKALNFAPEDPAGAAEWRVVYQNGGVSNDVAAQVQVLGVPTTSTSFYLWSEDEDAFWVVRDRMGNESELMDITVGWDGETPITVKRHVLRIDTIPNRDGIEYPYAFELRGGTAGSGLATNLILSGFHDFNWKKQGVSDKVRANDFLSVKVRCCDPRPPSVTLEVTPSTAYSASLATYACDTWATKIKLEFTQAYDAEDVVIELKPEMFIKGGAAATRPWSDYIRFAEGEGVDVTLQNADVVTHNPRLIVEKGHLKPTYIVTYPYGEGDKKKLQDDGIVYVYGLYADDESNGKKGQIQFGIDTENTGAKTAIDGWYKTAGLVLKAEAPVATMLPPVASVEATRTEAKEFTITVSDVYLSRDPDASSYALYYQTVSEGVDPLDNAWVQIPGEWKLSDLEGGVLKVTDAEGAAVLPKVTYNLTGTYDTYFYVKGANGLESAKLGANALKVKVTVKKANAVYAEIATSEEGPWAQSGTFDEGTTFYVRAHLDNKLESGKDVYVFLAPTDATACDFVDYAGNDVVTNVEGAVGLLIRGDATETEDTLRFRLADGVDPAKTIKLDVLLCETEEWDPAKRVTGFEQDRQLSIKARNLPPAFKQVMMGDNACVNKTGETMHDLYDDTWNVTVPLNVEKTFTFNVTEVDKDKKAEGDKAFKLKYTIRESDRSYPPQTVTLVGNPSTTNFTYAFKSAGTATITLQMQDKDMIGTENEWTEAFTFKVEVTAKAAVTLDVPASVDEDKTGAYELAPIDVGLSDGVSKELKVLLAVVPVEKTVTDVKQLGFVRIGGCDNVEPTVQDIAARIGSDTPVMAECYTVTLDKAGKRSLFVDACDGTDISTKKGYRVYAFITGDGTDPEGQPWAEHYVYDYKDLKVKNAKPSLLTCDLGATIEQGDSFTNTVGIGVDFQIKYTVGDIEADLTNGITAVWTGASAGNGLSTNICDSTNTYSATVRFSSSGLKILQLTLTDKDKTPYYTGRWYFLVESTKTLVTIPNGPVAKGDSTLSARYAGAIGRGEGHIWTEATFASADGHYMNWNCDPSATSVRIYGYGYKTNAVDNGTLDSEGDIIHDIAITPAGNSPATETTGYYAYTSGFDSFLYGWITYAAASGGGSAAGGAGAGSQAGTFALNPEVKLPTPTIAPLPTAGGNNSQGQNAATANYPTTYAEAVFSRELLPSDNLGDMNQDAVPDAYLVLNDYNFGIVDAATGASTGDDLRNVNFTQAGEGGTTEPYCADYLPTTETAAYASFIPGLAATWVDTGRPFVPRLKVRGFDEEDLIAIRTRGTSVSALNDAPQQIGMINAKPDRIYTNPREDAASTLNYVEWLAWSEWATAKYGPEAVTNGLHVTEWSPERPTNPTKADTDGDGLTDGWEYYIWYNAHVGYVENGVHKYLTGRAYDPRNPGAGKMITSADLETAFDPQNPTAFKLRDIDNDGLPDLIEFAIGTNPFDFDTDGDGLPDGFEILLNGTDPLNAYTTKGICDAMRNYDGDAMAFTTPELEEGVMPKPMNIESFVSFATVNDAFTGDSDGVQWYVGRSFEGADFDLGDPEEGHVIQVKGERYFTALDVRVTEDGRLATDLTALGAAWKVVNAQEKDVLELGVEVPPDLDYIRLAPARLAVGTQLELIEEQAPAEEEEEEELEEEEEEEEEEEPPAEPVMVEKYVVDRKASKVTFASTYGGLNAAWIYGSDIVSTETTANNMLNLGGFGMLAMGRYLDVEEGEALAELPSEKRPVALMHYLVYQEFGFDPRTAWNAHTPLAARWGSTVDGEVVESQYSGANGYAGIATRTREFTAYDEFLLLSFWLENGAITDADVTASQANPWEKIWSKYTTNPQGPGELWEPDNENFKGRTAETASDTNGADTDRDGVPDGWELYVMAGPKVQELFGGLKFNFAGPYNDNHFSHFGPFEADAASASWTDANGTSGYDSLPGDNDGLTELREFAGTDSCNWYSKPQEGNEVAFSTTIVRPDADAKWLNKFFPTDPWNKDTDMDGIPDGRETSNYNLAGTTARFMCGNFIYGTPVDNGSTSIPGGGLNPLTIDTDGDGLPDLWEAQFAGSTVYAGPDAELTKDADGNEGNPKQGLCDGMDGTVQDAFTYPLTVKKVASVGGTNNYEITHTAHNGMAQVVDRDYDHDGLQNWQEYLTGMMRCWRYDDPLSRWDAIPEDVYYKVDGNGKTTFDVSVAAKKMFPDEEDPVARFWYETLVKTDSEWYNPHLITGMSPANYMTRVTNPWDKAFTDEGTYYWLVDRIGETTLDALWCDPNGTKSLPIAKGMSPVPLKYASCSPIDPDSDHDGMDDYYELFHGMNPLLGASGVLSVSSTSDSLNESAGPCDLVYDAWYMKGVGALEAWAKSATDEQANYWQRDAGLKAKHDARFAKSGVTPPENGYDFEVYPWLNGLQMADPDADDIRNLYESIQPKLSGDFYLHTDPTPLWMTDSTYSNSLVRLFFRMPTRPAAIELADESFEYNENKYWFRNFDGYQPPVPMVSPAQLAAYTIDKWDVEGDGYNWMFSFEENEGYDSDHDFVSDYEEAQGTKRTASDPQDADSPRHRQAMYFPGMDLATGMGSVLQSLPEELEKHPLGVTDYPDTQLLQTFTVEVWVRPESVDPNVAQTVLERAVWVGPSQVADKEYMRKNFQIAIRKGKWYAKFDTNGTEPTNAENGKTFEFYSADDAAATAWTHIAVTYDGVNMTVFINGVELPKVAAHLPPANGTEAVVFDGKDGRIGDYWYSREYKYQAFVIGASLKSTAELGSEGYRALDVSQAGVFGWDAYTEFFRGYVDEIRVWDGARASDDVINDYANRRRYDRADALENRSAVYKAWLRDQRVPELLHHWTFDSVAGAENAAQVAKWPRGFGEGDGPVMSRPDGYVIDWWKKVVDAVGSVYAGNLDWVTWIPDTVGHLPRYDGTTLDSAYWSDAYAGKVPGEYAFPMTAEPVSRWTQMTYGGIDTSLRYRSTGLRHRLAGELFMTNVESLVYQQFEFTGRNRTCSGTDLLPLGGAFVKYVDQLWDDQGASSIWEQTGGDANANGLPDWWEAYADQNYRPEDMPPDEPISWSSTVIRQGVEMTAGEAYLRDLAAGMYVNAAGKIVNTHVEDGKVVSGTPYAQTAKSDGLIPDWWKDLFKISGADPLDDGDYDGLNNYHEYVASEVLPFSLRLDPLAARSDKQTLDYFQKVGKLYVGEMLTDHDMMEDGWERSLSDVQIADATIWDALKDGDSDGWTNFEENRYNGWKMSTLGQYVSHAVGDAEVLDAPVPSVKLTVRYNGTHFSSSTAGAAGGQGGQPQAGGQGGQGGQPQAGGKETGGNDAESISVSSGDIPNLVVKTYSDGLAQMADAEFSVKPGESVSGAVYLGGWEDRIVRGTMGPGNIDIGSVNLKFAQVPQSELYSWTDENGLHLSRPYAEFKAALEKNPDIIQNLQNFTWLELASPVNGYVLSDRAVTVTRDALTQKGYIAVYGERVGTIDLTTGEFEFNMGAMMTLSPNYTFATSVNDAWSYKEAIFKLTYSATVPSVQTKRFQVTLAQADKGFIRGGRNTIVAFFDNDGNGEYTPGEPFGVLNDVEIGWSGRALEIELADMSSVTPRVDLWSSESDRAALTVGANDSGAPEVVTIKTTETMTTNGVTTVRVVDQVLSNGLENVTAPAQKTTVNVSRYYVDGVLAEKAGLNGIEPLVFRQAFDSETRTFLHEGDFLKDGALDIDWGTFDAVTAFMRANPAQVYDLTNITYLVTFEEPADMSLNQPSNQTVKSLATLITRRFERERTVPTPYPVGEVFRTARPTFAWKIEGEDDWASKFGTTYTAFKVVVKKDLPNDKSVVYDSGVRRLPAKDRQGVYTWTAPLYVNSVTEKGVKFENLANYTWEVALYNAKFSDDAYMSVEERGNPFCAPQKFRMNVTTQDTSSRQVAVGVSYAGPAKSLKGKVRVQAFETPDFTGEAVAEVTVDAVGQTVTLIGLSEGSYFLRAYIDTNGNGVRDYWESWGYLCERDRANKPGLFNPVMAEAKFSPNTKDVRTVYIEDCDTNLNYFPDVWEAEQNGGKFDPAKIPPVDGNAELIGANPNLASTLSSGTKKTSLSSALPPKMNSLASVPGVALMTGLDLEDVVPTAGGFEVKSEVDPETLTIVGLNVDAANGRVLLKVGAETTANVDAAVANFLNVTVKRGAEVTVKVEHADSPNGPWTVAKDADGKDVNGTVTVDRAGTDIEVKLGGELPAQGYFRAKIEEK